LGIYQADLILGQATVSGIREGALSPAGDGVGFVLHGEVGGYKDASICLASGWFIAFYPTYTVVVAEINHGISGTTGDDDVITD
jgi:hypothetical protein